MPVIVLADGPTAATTGHDISECQVLVKMKGSPDAFCLYILLIRFDASRWISVSPGLNVTLDDWTGEEMTSVGRNAALPLEGRPFLVHDRLDRVGLRALWARAFTLAEIHGAAVGPPPLTGPAGWFCADATQKTFGMEVPAVRLANPTLAKLASVVGILRLEDGTWVYLERVRRCDVAAWRVQKSAGIKTAVLDLNSYNDFRQILQVWGPDFRPAAAADPAARSPRPITQDESAGSSGAPTVLSQAAIHQQQRMQREEDDHASRRRQGMKGAGKDMTDGVG